MKILSKKEQKELMDFIGEEYLVAIRSNQRGLMNINKFGQIQSRIFKMAEIVTGRNGLAVLNERMALMERIRCDNSQKNESRD